MRLRDLENINEPPPVPIPPEEKKPEPPKPEPPNPEPPKKASRKLLPWLAAAACVVVLLGIWIGTARGKPEPTDPGESIGMQAPPETKVPPETMTPPKTTVPPETMTPPETTVLPEPWKTNILRSDEVPMYEDGIYMHVPSEHSVFGSAYARSEISSVTFLSTLSDAPEDAWDVSEAGDGSVKAWVEPEGDRYRLCIAGEGGVSAGRSCRNLFAGYQNLQSFRFDGNFHTDTAENMDRMFYGCRSLTALDLSGFDTAKVEGMGRMFYNCNSLTALDLSSFNTSNVRDMSEMFYICKSLTALDLSSFDTAKVEDMSQMFKYCYSLASLDLSSFDTAKVENMSHMFGSCKSLTALDLSSFDTAKVEDMSQMFKYCYSLTNLNLRDRFVTTNADTSDMFALCPAGDDWGHLLN